MPAPKTKHYVCKKQCFHNGRPWYPGEVMELNQVRGKVPHHFVTDWEYAGILYDAEEAAKKEAVKEAKQSTRDTSKVDEEEEVKPFDPEKYCEECDQEFSTRQGYLAHIRHKHSEDK